jgi:phosphopantetheinyl transferase (holo-ACP synthase)
MSNAILTESEISRVRELLGLKHLEVHLRPVWGSQNPGFRENIHGDLKSLMAKAYPLSDSSISHSRTLGGFAFTQFDYDQLCQLGFDLEETERVSHEVSRRICATQEEYDKAPSDAALWSAKEACFKALKGENQPKTVSQIVLTSWTQIDSQFETVSVANPKEFKFSKIFGVVLKKNVYTFAFFVCLP